ncbi:MAG TPA: Nramp family divalent metal transporter [Virgibacillus sp.]|nr:Nramp family divalent metal transporter [Virgibacillus sp.]HLR68369.1 Nramp family divalent metal transporter [Virgibacillus sp.]
MKTKLLGRLKNLGPGAVVAAAIVGPGTVTTASQVGAQFGFTLIWTLIFSIVATMFLQEMVTRLGIVSRKDLGTAFREQFENPILKILTIILIVSAIGIGNAAYETGNIVGGAIGLSTITGMPVQAWGMIIGVSAGLLLWFGSYKMLEKVFVGLIGLMSFSFLITAIVVKPDLGAIFKGAFIPTIPDGGIILIISLIGTTIVPYTLFLQSSIVQERWKSKEGISESRFDIITSLIVVGIMASSIIITAAMAFPLGTQLDNPTEMANQLEPLLGSWAKYVFSIGIFAAGTTSAMTAPLGAAYAITGVLGWERNLKSIKFRVIWMIIILVGIFFTGLGYSPIQIIVFSQYANGLILPIIVLFLLFVMNNRRTLGDNVNKLWINIVGWVIFAITLALALLSFDILG